MTEQDDQRASFVIPTGDEADELVIYDRENYQSWLQCERPVAVRQ